MSVSHDLPAFYVRRWARCVRCKRRAKYRVDLHPLSQHRSACCGQQVRTDTWGGWALNVPEHRELLARGAGGVSK